ncbi:FliM/FliN family flagellar motor switch protein [Novosphingobium sediminicola]|uniref:Flagellar motor switch protein FliM n=1 Tax=Novosphingobium sediminicola TaxID=563162 RepID=A0A7W6CHB6_9SPHN|nr:FliM/FliN family flagellar motor switch protein [Novosphingobium sediminicola]MBB3956553.1 flagellar motor switch protein FliM [Novosphingobium sediminicola]
MKPQREFIAERPLAEHCPELLKRGPAPEDLLHLLEKMGQRFARRLSGAFAPLMGGEAPIVSCTSPRETKLSSLNSSIAALAANSLLAIGSAQTPMLVSIEAEPVLRIVDRAFGGKGEAPAPMPKQFPPAAELMIARLEVLLAEHLAAAVTATAGRASDGDMPDITAIRRDGSLTALSPFDDNLPLAMLSLEVDDGGVLPWLMTVAMPFATLGRIFGYAEKPARRAAPHYRGDPMAAPFGDVPVTLSAVLVDMRVPFPAIATLAPGVILPVSVSRQIPLRVGENTIAHGTVGTMDDRVAVKIDKAFTDERTNP